MRSRPATAQALLRDPAEGRPARRVAVGLLVALVLSAGRSTPARAAYDVEEIKAALLGKLADFVTWPPEAGLGDPDRPFEIVVLGRTPLMERLRELYERRQVRIAGRRVWVRGIDDVREIGRPHLLFLASSTEPTLSRILTRLGQQPVLTVADTERFAERGVAVNFYLSDNRVRFELSLAALKRHRLQASYRLLGMARIIDRAMEGAR